MEPLISSTRPQISFRTRLVANTQFIPKPSMPPCSSEVNELIKQFETELQKRADETNEFLDYSKLYSERDFSLSNWREYGKGALVEEKPQSRADESSSFDFVSESGEETTDEEFKI